MKNADSLLQQHVSSPSDRPLILEPIALVPRLRIRFSWLDTYSSSHGDLFSSDMAELDDSVSCGRVLVGRISSGDIRIVEKVRKGVYALSRLGVDEGRVLAVAAALEETGGEKDGDEEDQPADGNWYWKNARIDEPFPCPGDDEDDVVVVFSAGVDDDPVDDDPFVDGPVELPGPLPSPPPSFSLAPNDYGQSPQEMLDCVREQYLHTLYTSKVQSLLSYRPLRKVS